MNHPTPHLSRSIMHLANDYQAYRERSCKSFGIGRSDMDVLFQLITQDRPMSLGEIAKRSAKDRALIGRAAKHLEEMGLVEFEHNEFHKQKKDVVLTPRGRKTAQAVRDTTLAWERAVGERLGARSEQQLMELIDGAAEVAAELIAE